MITVIKKGILSTGKGKAGQIIQPKVKRGKLSTAQVKRGILSNLPFIGRQQFWSDKEKSEGERGSGFLF